MRKTLHLVLAVVFALVTGDVAADSAPELLEQAIYAEETKGDLKGACEAYRRVVGDAKADGAIVAQAQLRLGLCELKLGNKPQALSVLESLVQQFPDRPQMLALLQSRTPELLEEITRQIEKHYIVPVEGSELYEAGLRAIMGELGSKSGFLRTNDPVFLSASELSQLNENVGQKIAGIGAVLKPGENERGVVLRSPLPGSPALRAGLRAGDRIRTIDGTELPEEKALNTAVTLLRGAPGSTVTVRVERAGAPELLEVHLVRDTVRLPSVKGHVYRPDFTWELMLDESRKIGYVRLTQLGQESALEMKAALEELVARGMKALILDLRDNPGGLLAGAVAVADLFLESGRIVTLKGRGEEKVFDAQPGALPELPLAVLVNRQTASAAEIVAASLQDHQRAVVIGERTFGQGVVRSIFPLESGVGALKLPVAAYYRPSGRSMNRYPDSRDTDEWGVRPNTGFEVVLTEQEAAEQEKARAARDIPNNEAASTFEDRVLKRALEYVVAQMR